MKLSKKSYLSICKLCMAFAFLIGIQASADEPKTPAASALSGYPYIENLMGNRLQAQVASRFSRLHWLSDESCANYGGIIGNINSLMCRLEKDMGLRGPGIATKSYDGIEMHAEIKAKEILINQITYDYQGMVWICPKSRNCKDPQNFARSFYLAFTMDILSDANRGYILTAPGLFAGYAGSALELVYDFGSLLGNNSNPSQLDIKGVIATSNKDNDLSTYSLRFRGQKTDDLAQMNLAGYFTPDIWFRFGMSQPVSNTQEKESVYNFYLEAEGGQGYSGYFPLDAANLGAPNADDGLCISTPNQAKDLKPVIIQKMACKDLSFKAFDHYAQKSKGQPSVEQFSVSEILANWHGMDRSPKKL